MQNDIKPLATDFLKRNGMDPGAIDIGQGCEVFIREMELGLVGTPGSLKMIPTYIGTDKEIPVGEPVIAIDAGGTNLRVSVVTFDKDRKPVIEGFSAHPMPGTKGRISREEFFNTVAEYLSPILDRAEKIGFCFSYPTEMQPNGDGRLIRFCKEVQVDDVEGELIGEGLLDAIERCGGQRKQIVLLNDTVATLLGGKAARASRVYGSYIGFILGTGLNSCYIERNAAITKLTGLDKSKNMVINIESGAYDKTPRGEIDLAFDACTTNPGEHAFEKMISGGYFGDLALAVLKKAAGEGLVSPASAKNLAALSDLGMKDVNDFVDDPWGSSVLSVCCGGRNNEGSADRTAVYFLIDALYERAARLAAVNLSSVVMKTGAGQDPCRPVCVTAEGTMFHKSRLFRLKLNCHMKNYLEDTLGLYCEFIEVESSTLLGTAIAGLTGCV